MLLYDYTPADVGEAVNITAIGISMAEATVGLKRDGLAGAGAVLGDPFMAAQIAGNGGSIFELVKDHFLPPPEDA